jgi:SAM-dependent methyltransferase
MPVRDEAACIETTLASLLAQDYPADRFEVVVLDGRSRDDTRERIAAVARRDARVRLFDNPGVIVSTALNLGFGRARGDWVVRADGHSTYAPDYVKAAMRAARASGADVVGGPMLAHPRLAPFQQAVAAALGSRCGMGGAAFHFADRSGPAESVYLGTWRRDALARFGGFHEELVRDEDDEWFARARRLGAKVWLDPSIRSSYVPRATAGALLRQYFEYGLWKPSALRCVPGSWRWRHLVPSALVAALVLPLLAGVPRFVLLAALAYAAALVAGVASTRGQAGRGLRAALRQAAVFALMHLGYGVGFFAGLFRRVHARSTAELRAIYRAYAQSRACRRAWSATQPGQAALIAERDAALARQLRDTLGARLATARLLDLGSGERDLAAVLAAHGAKPGSVVACDLLTERLDQSGAPRRVAADSRLLPFADGRFDAVVQCTMLSSIRARAARRVIAAEMERVCKRDGVIVSYDARVGNPLNRNVRRVAREEHAALFPGRRLTFERLTPLPPLARRAPRLLPWLARCKPLCLFDLMTATPVADGASA